MMRKLINGLQGLLALGTIYLLILKPSVINEPLKLAHI